MLPGSADTPPKGALTCPAVSPVVVGLVGGAMGRRATELTSVTSPRTSIVVSRSGSYAMPPGTRLFWVETAPITSVSVKPCESSRNGSTSTSYAGVTSPMTLANETPGIC